MFEENELVRAAATECMCNLVLSTEVTQISLTPKCISIKEFLHFPPQAEIYVDFAINQGFIVN